MKIKKKKHVLLVDEASDWLQIWTVASSLDVKGNKAIKKKFVFLATGWFSQIRSHICITFLAFSSKLSANSGLSSCYEENTIKQQINEIMNE